MTEERTVTEEAAARAAALERTLRRRAVLGRDASASS